MIKSICESKMEIARYEALLKMANDVATSTKSPELFYVLDERLTRGERALEQAAQVMTQLALAREQRRNGQ